MRRAIMIVTALTGVLLMTVLILTCILPLDYQGSALDSITEMSGGWIYADGTPADPMGIRFDNKESTITHTINGDTINGRELCFISRNVNFTVCLDDTVIYDFHPHLTGLYGEFYGDHRHTIQLPSFSGEKILRFECSAILENKWTGFDGLVLQDSWSYIRTIQSNSAPKFIICLATLFLGLILFIYGLIEELFHNQNMIEPMTLGVTGMILSCWASFSTNIVQMISQNYASSRVFEHIALTLLPIPILIYVASVTRQMHSPLPYISVGLCLLNLTTQCALVMAGGIDYHDMLPATHALIIWGILAVSIMIGQAIRHHSLDKEQKYFLLSAFCLIFLSGLADMVRYYFTRSSDAAHYSRVGLFLFVAILSVYQLRRLISMEVKLREAEAYERMAMEDALTGLRNRAAFNKHEAELRKRGDGKCIFVHLDVNNLKKVNDNFGHAEGDRHIKAAANTIYESFGQYGMCYRVGGDEFFAILEGHDCMKDYEKAVAAFRVRQRQYNEQEHPPVELQLAHGMAVYEFREHNPEVAEKLADSRMYENKRMLKLANA